MDGTIDFITSSRRRRRQICATSSPNCRLTGSRTIDGLQRRFYRRHGITTIRPWLLGGDCTLFDADIVKAELIPRVARAGMPA